MSPERWAQISRIFKSAISLDGEARAAYVAGQCGVDESLRAEVEKLIESHQQASAANFIGGGAAEDGAPLLIGPDELTSDKRRLEKEQQLGSYVILDSLGAGGMGEVYLARDSRLDRTVALKVLSEDVSADKRRMQRFRQEAKVASSLNQPNILTIFEFGEIDGLTFLATEFIDGKTLRDYLHKQQLKLGEIIDITIQMLAALDAAHEARIVHRDIKPENVMIRRRDNVVKVLDFGLAKVTEKKTTVATEQSDLEAVTAVKTAPGIMMGTINYMSPEQAQARGVDERTDIWSTGVMLYEMVAGTMPFKGATTVHALVQIIDKDPAPLTYVGQPAPAELRRIVSKALAKNPEERYQTAKDMLIDLRSLKKQLETGSSLTTDETDRKSKNPWTFVVALAAVTLLAVAFWGVYRWRASRVTTTTAPLATPAPAPAAVGDQRVLTYWITVQKFKFDKPFQEPFTLAGEINFEADYQIRLNVRSPQGGYLYVLNEGPREESAPAEFLVVFPSSTANKGSAVVSAEQTAQIPEESWLKFDAQQGVEKLWLVFAQEPVPELDALKQFANTRTKGLITDPAQNRAIQNFLTTRSADAGKPSVEKGERLTTLKAPGKLLIYPVKLEHH